MRTTRRQRLGFSNNNASPSTASDDLTVIFKTKFQPQYPMTPMAAAVVQRQAQSMKGAGILHPTRSVWNLGELADQTGAPLA